MKRSPALLAMVLCLLCWGPTASAQYTIPSPAVRADTALSGDWRGNVIASNGRRFQLLLHINASLDGDCSVTYDIVDQQQYGRRMTTASCNAYNLLFINDSVAAQFTGICRPHDGIIDGVWEQAQTRVPTRLYKIRPLERSQEPATTAPYTTRDLVIPHRAAGVQLGGSLSLPSGSGLWPLVILVSDRGQQNRDALDATGHRPFAVIADLLARQGFAALRMDDRGTGASTPGPAPSQEESIADLLVVVDRIANEPGINGQAIILLGHGAGGLVATRVAQQRPDRIAGIVYASTPAMDGKTWLLEVARATDALQGIDPDVTQAAVELLGTWYDEVERESATDDQVTVRRIAETTDSVLAIHGEFLVVYPAAVRLSRPDRETYIRNNLLPWLRGFRDSRAPDVLSRIPVPALALVAERDAVVPSAFNLAAWKTIADEVPTIDVALVEGVNHGFQPCTLCTEEEAEVSRVTVDPEVITRITSWASRLVGR